MYGFARLLSAWLVPFRFQKRNNLCFIHSLFPSMSQKEQPLPVNCLIVCHIDQALFQSVYMFARACLEPPDKTSLHNPAPQKA